MNQRFASRKVRMAGKLASKVPNLCLDLGRLDRTKRIPSPATLIPVTRNREEATSHSFPTR